MMDQQTQRYEAPGLTVEDDPNWTSISSGPTVDDAFKMARDVFTNTGRKMEQGAYIQLEGICQAAGGLDDPERPHTFYTFRYVPKKADADTE